MTLRTTIERNTNVATDEYGMPGAAAWAPSVAGVACWLFSRAEREVVDARKTAVIEDLRMYLPKGTDVTEKDRLNGVVDRRGAVVRAGLLAIEAVINRHTHLELAVSGIES